MKKTERFMFRRPQKALIRQHYGVVAGISALVIAIALAASYGIMDLMERRTHSSAEKLVNQGSSISIRKWAE